MRISTELPKLVGDREMFEEVPAGVNFKIQNLFESRDGSVAFATVVYWDTGYVMTHQSPHHCDWGSEIAQLRSLIESK